jgi:hypothetical protein
MCEKECRRVKEQVWDEKGVGSKVDGAETKKHKVSIWSDGYGVAEK